jgi:hypothetical protein
MVSNNLPGPGEPADPIEQALGHLHKAEHDLEEARKAENRAEGQLHDAAEELAHAEHPRETEIVVNGRPRKVPGHEVSYAEILELAFPGPHTDPNVIFSMTYRHAASHPSSGELGPGGTVKVREGTVFNVTRTVKS